MIFITQKENLPLNCDGAKADADAAKAARIADLVYMLMMVFVSFVYCSGSRGRSEARIPGGHTSYRSVILLKADDARTLASL